METSELSCKELVELVTEYLEDTLPTAARARFEAHLATCPGCRVYLDQVRQTVRALGKLAEEAIPPEARRELLQAFRNWKRAGPTW